jgi:phenylalanyl-tRNA synthetase beta chain
MNLGVGRSPFWMRNRLGMAGVRAINSIVDATNYVLMEYGHPLHAFDLQALHGGAIVVRTARRGERITTIDGRERELNEQILVIADAERPVALAGIMGGVDSEVGGGTSAVLLESACFKPQSIRRASKMLNLATESSYRFERGADYCGLVPVLDRAAYFIALCSGGTVCKGVIDKKASARRQRRIILRIPRLNSLLNARLSRSAVKGCLECLHMGARAKGKEALTIIPPSYRVDIAREIDLIEEVARLQGYDRIQEVPPIGCPASSGGDRRTEGRERVRGRMCALGFTEAVCLSFMGLAEMDRLMWRQDSPLRRAVRLRNPVSEDLSYLRTSMLPPLMRCLALNASRGNNDVRFFEFGAVFSPPTEGGMPREREKLVLATMGKTGGVNWCTPAREVDFFYLKGVLEALCEGAGVEISIRRAALPGCHPGRGATLSWGGIEWGWMGEMHPRVAEAYDIRVPVVFAEVDAGPLLAAALEDPTFRPLPRFPAVRRDIALVADAAMEAGKIIESVRTAVPGLAESVEIFDLFTGAQIPAGKKGIAVSIKLRSLQSTLTEGDIEKAMGDIFAAILRLGCEIRK